MSVLDIFWISDPCLRYHWQICFPIRWFFFQFNALFFSNAEAFYFVKVPFVYSFLYVPCFRDITGHGDVHSHVSVKMLLSGMSEIFLPMFSLGLLWCYDLYLSLLSTLNLFLYMV